MVDSGLRRNDDIRGRSASLGCHQKLMSPNVQSNLGFVFRPFSG